MQANKETVISRIKDEIDKIDKKTNTIYFFVIDTKGNPSGSLSYIYNLALILSKNGYNIGMLYQEDEEFVGVKDWLGDEFANLPHYDITSGDVSVSASDILFIPELFSNLMIQTKQLPCKRIVILQNYDFVLEQMPMASQWGDFGIMEAIVNTEANEELIKDIFPYVKTTVIDPYIENYFGETQEPKKMIINIISKNQTDINKIIKEVQTSIEVAENELFNLAVILKNEADDKRIWDGSIDKVNTDIEINDEKITEFKNSEKYMEPIKNRMKLLNQTAYISKKVLEEGWKIGYMRRDEAMNENDSGWQFLAGNEDDEYLNKYKNIVEVKE